MNRQRSISDSGGTRGSSLTLADFSTLQSTPRSDKALSKAALMEVLSTYKFRGKIVLWKSQEEYGFLRSDQFPGDIFFSHVHATGLSKNKEEGNQGKSVQFQIEDVGRRSIEGRNVVVVEANQGPQFLSGVLTNWVKTGALIQVSSPAKLSHNRIFAPHQECSTLGSVATNVLVMFRVHVDKHFRAEAREVSMAEPKSSLDLSKTIVKNRKDSVTNHEDDAIILKDFADEDFSKNLIKDIGKMSAESLGSFFERNIKLKFQDFVHQGTTARIIIAVISRVSQTGAGKLEEKISRMMRADFMAITSSKQGCAVVQALLDRFSRPRKVLLAEQVAELDTVEDFTNLWTHGSNIFISMLELMEDNSLSTVGFSLLGNYEELACHIGHYKPVRALILKLVNTEVFTDILQELDLVKMSSDRFGHHITIALLDSVPGAVKDYLIQSFQGEIARLSMDPVCSSVIVAAIKAGSTKQQANLIEEVCTVATRQADMDVARLVMDRFGHEVVLAMLEVSRHKHIHNVLKGVK